MSFRYLIGPVLSCSLLANSPGDAQRPVHPKVIAMNPPTCPPMVRISHITGTAVFAVKTDGHKISEFLRSQGPPMLVRQLPKQLSSWQFEDHVPTELSITFKVTVLPQNPCDPSLPDEVRMILPSLVEITAYAKGECDPVIETVPSK